MQRDNKLFFFLFFLCGGCFDMLGKTLLFIALFLFSDFVKFHMKAQFKTTKHTIFGYM